LSETSNLAGPPIIVIFGTSGDLARRKLIPALYQLHRKGRLPPRTKVVGCARRPYDHQSFRAEMREALAALSPQEVDAGSWDRFAQDLWYVQGDLDDSGHFEALKTFLDSLGPASLRLYYLATAPEFFPIIVQHLGQVGLVSSDDRVVVEKPFGQDLGSAQALNQVLHTVFQESQVYRIDHYLGKETAQNILFFRFANTIFEPVWNRNYVEYVQIAATEEVDIGKRGEYYDKAGVMRDVFQNHLLQLLSLVAMEPPYSFQADAVRNEKVKLLSSLRPVQVEDTVRGQYTGYTQAPGVAPQSTTATFAALRLYIDNWRWQGVPFYLRSGKAMAMKATEIAIQFKSPPVTMFTMPPDYQMTPNLLVLGIQPDEGIHLVFETKVPDSIRETRSVDMDFHYHESFGGGALPEAYERLLLDALQGDASLFTRSDEIEAAWRMIDSILEGWDRETAPPLVTYAPGSWGPSTAEDLVKSWGHRWHLSYAGHS
jgi:glucose-6-phosphate 1-dehydrogenase